VGAYVVYDPYWDPVDSYATQTEAELSCQRAGRNAGCHVIYKDKIEPGQHFGLPYVQKPWED
jgi:hypothetical protein